MICLGIDPDTFNTGIALVRATHPTKASKKRFEVLHVDVAEVNKKLSVQARIREMCSAIEYEMWSMGRAGDEDTQRVCVEGQVHYPGSPVRPNDLIHLAQVAGMAAGTALSATDLGKNALWIPDPRDWKGTMKKADRKVQILKSVGLNGDLMNTEHELVPGANRLNALQRGHVIDAIGLAVWVAQQPERRGSV